MQWRLPAVRFPWARQPHPACYTFLQMHRNGWSLAYLPLRRLPCPSDIPLGSLLLCLPAVPEPEPCVPATPEPSVESPPSRPTQPAPEPVPSSAPSLQLPPAAPPSDSGSARGSQSARSGGGSKPSTARTATPRLEQRAQRRKRSSGVRPKPDDTIKRLPRVSSCFHFLFLEVS